MSNAPQSPIRIIALALIAVVASLDVLLAAAGALHTIPDVFVSSWNGEAGLLTPRYPFIDSWAGIEKTEDASYAGVHIVSDEPLPVPRALQAADLALASLIRILGGTLVVLFVVRLLARKSVSGLARWGLLALGILIMLKGMVGPQLHVLAVNVALGELDYPVMDPGAGGGYEYTENSPETLTPGLLGIWAVGPTDSLLFITGVIIAVLGFLFADRLRLTPAPVAQTATT